MKQRIKKVTLSEAKENIEYWNMVKHIYKEQIVRTIQSHFRQKHNKKYAGYAKQLTRLGSNGLQFILEHEGKETEIKVEDIVQKIKLGKWEELQFDDDEFIRNLFKALRLAKITANEMATALLLHGTRLELREEKITSSGLHNLPAAIKKYRFDDSKGPYSPFSISYAYFAQVLDFRTALKSLPDSEQYYFSLNFSHKREIAFLYESLKTLKLGKNDRFYKILTKYVDRFEIKDESEKEKWGINALNKRDSNDEIDRVTADKLLRLIEAKEDPQVINFANDAFHPIVFEILFSNPEKYKKYFEEYKIPTDIKDKIELNLKNKEFEHARRLFYSHCIDNEMNAINLCEYFNFQYHVRPDIKYILTYRLDNYLLEFVKDPEKLKILSKLVNDIKGNNEKEVRKAAKKLDLFIKSNLSSYARDYLDYTASFRKDSVSSGLLLNILAVKEQDPWIELSPDYKKEDPKSPLICEVIPTMSAFDTLLRVMHGADTTRPAFLAGQFTPQIIRGYDEKMVGDLKQQSRPVELTHPDLLSTDDVHGARPPHDALLTRHDLFHCWRNSAEKNKPFIRYLRKMLENEKKYDMSKAIWELSDMDLSGGRLMRQLEKTYEEAKFSGYGAAVKPYFIQYKAGHLDRILTLSGRFKESGVFWNTLDAHDDNLLLIVDMIVHQKKWEQYLGDSLQFMFDNNPDKDTANYKKFINIYNELKKIAGEDSPYGQLQGNMFYILAYRLKDHPKGPAFCEELQKIELKNMLHWERNSGLYFYPDMEIKNRVIEKLNPEELYSQLNDIFKVISKSHFSTRQSPILCILAYRLKNHPKVDELLQLLEKIDIDKILKIKKSDKKIYFLDLKTGLTTAKGLPSNNDELYALLMDSIHQLRQLETKEVKHTLASEIPKTPTIFHPLKAAPPKDVKVPVEVKSKELISDQPRETKKYYEKNKRIFLREEKIQQHELDEETRSIGQKILSDKLKKLDPKWKAALNTHNGFLALGKGWMTVSDVKKIKNLKQLTQLLTDDGIEALKDKFMLSRGVELGSVKRKI